MRNFRLLDCWKLGMEIVKLTYPLLEILPATENYGLRSQISRAVISMPSNIAEGCSRSSNKELARFFEISIGSAFELETQLIAGQLVGYFKGNEVSGLIDKIQIFQKQTNAYRNKLI